MQKELIYKLIENAYGDKPSFNRFMTEFIEKLKDEGYFEMANVIQNIQYKSTTGTLSKKVSNDFSLYSPKIVRQTDLIKKGYELEIIKSIILYGEPGTGKTFFVDQLASFLKIKVYKLSLSEIMDSRYGETIRRFENFFKSRLNERCIIFIDEAESLFSKRGKRNDVFESDRLLTTALQLFDSKRESLLILATNLFENLDAAITRRFDLLINFDEFEINVKKLFKNKMERWPLEIEKKEIDEAGKFISQNLIRPKFSDIDFLSRKFALERISGNDFSYSKQELLKVIENLNKNRKEIND